MKALRQQQREAAAARQRSRDQRNLLITVGIIAVFGLAILVVALYLKHQADVQTASRLPFHTVTGTVGTAVPDEGPATHITPGTSWNYKFYPPTSGPHWLVPGSAPAPWQDTTETLAEGQFVHNLEHGGIAILYNCPTGDGCSTLKSQLENYVKNLAPQEPNFNEVKVVMTPYSTGMGSHRIALVAWHYIMFLDSYDQNAITQFYENHVDQGPEQIA